MKGKNRRDFFIAIAKIKIENLTEKEISEILIDYDKGDKLSNLASFLQEKYSGVTNVFLSDVYELLFGGESEFWSCFRRVEEHPINEFSDHLVMNLNGLREAQGFAG